MGELLPTRDQVALSVRHVENVARDYRSALDAVIATMGNNVWIGPTGTAFGNDLSARRTRLRQLLDQAVADAHRVLASTPVAPPAPVPVRH